MLRVSNLLNRPRVFTLKDGKSFRLLSFETKELEKNKVTKEIENNAKAGFLLIEQLSKVTPVKVKKEEVKE